MTLETWKTGPFDLPGVRPGTVLAEVDGGCPTHHTCLETLNRASREQVQLLHTAMVSADVALFTALGHYWTGVARILQAELEDSESDGLTAAADDFTRALEQVQRVREHEEQILAVAQPIEYSAYFVRRHQVISLQTAELAQGLEAMRRDLADGYYPAPASSAVNRVLTQMSAHFEQDARIEGVLTRIEMVGGTAS